MTRRSPGRRRAGDTPARVRWISQEPALEPINFRFKDELSPGVRIGNMIDWVVVGGESNGRPFDPEIARWTRDQTQDEDIACFVKQMGSRPVGLSLQDPKGENPDEWPADLRVREYPV